MKDFGIDLFDSKKIEDILLGEGGSIKDGEHKAAVFKDNNGKLKMSSAKCALVGCTVVRNSRENYRMMCDI